MNQKSSKNKEMSDDAKIKLAKESIKKLREKISPEKLQEEQKIGLTTVVDVANSLEYKVGHIPRAWWIVRSRMIQSLEKISGNGPLVFTSPDGQLAGLSAIDAKSLTKRPIKILEGGTKAWKSSGFPLIEGFSVTKSISAS